MEQKATSGADVRSGFFNRVYGNRSPSFSIKDLGSGVTSPFLASRRRNKVLKIVSKKLVHYSLRLEIHPFFHLLQHFPQSVNMIRTTADQKTVSDFQHRIPMGRDDFVIPENTHNQGISPKGQVPDPG